LKLGLLPRFEKKPFAKTEGFEVKQMGTQQPLAKFRAGAVSCAVWENEATVNGRQIEILKATLERRFKDASGTWKSSNSFSRNEIPLAIYCLEKAFAMIIEERSTKGSGNGNGEFV
jgi:hypothetical protein